MKSWPKICLAGMLLVTYVEAQTTHPSSWFRIDEPFDQSLHVGDSISFRGVAKPFSKILIGVDTVVANDVGRWSARLPWKGDSIWNVKFSLVGDAWSVERKLQKLRLDPKGKKVQIVLAPWQLQDASQLVLHTLRQQLGANLLESGWRTLAADPETCPASCAKELASKMGADWYLRPVQNIQAGQHVLSLELYPAGTAVPARVWSSSLERRTQLIPAFQGMTDSLLEALNQWKRQIPAPRLNLDLETQAQSVVLSGQLPTVLTPGANYVLTGTAVVPVGQKTVLEPGVKISAAPGSNLLVFGTLEVKGDSLGRVEIKSLSSHLDSAWNGIEIRSNQPQVWSHLYISGAQNGLQAWSSNLWWEDVQFEGHRAMAVALAASDLTWKRGGIGGGHVVGLLADQSSYVNLDEVLISGNQEGFLGLGASRLHLHKSAIRGNGRGLLLDEQIALQLKNSTIEKNNQGVVVVQKTAGRVETLLPKLKGLKDNQDPIVPMSPGERDLLIAKLDWENLREVPLWRIKGFEDKVESFEDLAAQEEGWSGYIRSEGGYTKLLTKRHQSPRPWISGTDTVQDQDFYLNRFKVAGPFSKTEFYGSYQDSIDQLEIQGTLLWDRWADWTTKPMLLDWKRGVLRTQLGDYRTPADAWTYSGDRQRGASLFLGKDPAPRWLDLGLGAHLGEARAPLLVGERDPDVFGETITEGEARAQRIVGGIWTRLRIQENFEWTTGLAWMRDLEKSWFREQVLDTIVTREARLRSNNLYSNLNFETPWGLRVQGSLAFGAGDSIGGLRLKAVERWLIARNVLNEADTLRTLLGPGSSRTPWRIQQVLPTDLNMTAKEVIAEVDSIEASLSTNLEKQRTLGFGFESKDLAWEVQSAWRRGGWTLDAQGKSSGRNYLSPSLPVSNAREWSLGAGWSGKQWKHQLRYQILVDDAESESQSRFWGWEENGLWGTDALKERTDSLYSAHPRIQHVANIKESWTYQGLEIRFDGDWRWRHQFQNRILQKDSSMRTGLFRDPVFEGTDTIVRFGESYAYDSQKWAAFIAGSDTLASGFQSRVVEWRAQADLKYTLGDWQMQSVLQWTTKKDASRFAFEADPLKELGFSDFSRGLMGYHPESETQSTLRFPLSLRFAAKGWESRVQYWNLHRDLERDQEESQEHGWGLDLSIPIWKRVLQADLSYTGRSLEQSRDAIRYDYEDSLGLRYPYVEVGDQGSTPLMVPTQNALDVSPGVDIPGFVLKERRYRLERQDQDLMLQAGLKWNLGESWTWSQKAEYAARLRPDQTDEDHEWWTFKTMIQHQF